MKYIHTLLLGISLILVCSVAWGQPMNEKYSYKAFSYHGVSFKDRPASEFNNTVIRGSCFYQEWVEGEKDIVKDIFPDGMTGVTFEWCNLDNIHVPVGNIMVGGTNKCIQIQNDTNDWIMEKVNDKWKPKEPINKKLRIKSGISCEAKDIPDKKLTKEEQEQFMDNILHEEIIVNP